MLDAQHLSTCQACTARQSQSHWRKSLRMISSAPTPTSPVGDHTAVGDIKADYWLAPTVTSLHGRSQRRRKYTCRELHFWQLVYKD